MPFNRQLQHLTMLAKSEYRGWQVYAWNRALELDADTSELWTGIASDLKQCMTGPERVLESGRQSHGKRPSALRKSV